MLIINGNRNISKIIKKQMINFVKNTQPTA